MATCGCGGTGSVDGWVMQDICTIKDLADLCKRRLGSPILCVQMTDQHLLDCCCQAIRMAYRYLYGEATKRDYLIMKLLHGQTQYRAAHKDKDGNEVEGNVYTLIWNDIEKKLEEQPIDPEEWCKYTYAWDFSIMNLFGGINTLHSAENLLLSDWARNLTKNGGGLVSYDAAMTWLKQVDNQFGAHFQASMHEPSHTLTVLPMPKYDTWALLQIWKKAEVHEILNNPLVMDLAQGYSFMQLGVILNKYQIQLAGGGTLNGADFYNQGKELVDATMERLRGEADPPMFFMG